MKRAARTRQTAQAGGRLPPPRPCCQKAGCGPHRLMASHPPLPGSCACWSAKVREKKAGDAVSLKRWSMAERPAAAPSCCFASARNRQPGCWRDRKPESRRFARMHRPRRSASSVAFLGGRSDEAVKAKYTCVAAQPRRSRAALLQLLQAGRGHAGFLAQAARSASHPPARAAACSAR